MVTFQAHTEFMSNLNLFLPDSTIALLHMLAREREQRLGDLIRDLATKEYVDRQRVEGATAYPGFDPVLMETHLAAQMDAIDAKAVAS